jgi:thiamine biosynthesis protein ThiI
MKVIIKLHPEITIKSKSVRRRFTKLLENNIRIICKQHGFSVAVLREWDKLLLIPKENSSDSFDDIIDVLSCIPGVDQIQLVTETEYQDFEDIFQQVKRVWTDKLAGKSYCIRVKRRGEHNFTSIELARYVGGGLLHQCETGGVKLKQPDVTISLEVESNKLIMVDRQIRCLGGLPLPTQDDVLSLISGGFDSSVASYLTIKRGSRTHFCFFNLGGQAHEIAVRQLCYYLWNRYSSSHKVKFIAVDFQPIVTEIVEKTESGQMGVVLKRMMLRAASLVADILAINTLVTGESMSQVSSQTLTNLHVIEQVTSKLILRPLICMDKDDIIKVARAIGTEDFAKTIPEYCGVISRKPTVCATQEKIAVEESKFDLLLIKQAVNAAKVVDIREIAKQTERDVAIVQHTSELPADSIVIDIRAPREEELNPLKLSATEVQLLPFYKVASHFGKFDQSKDYYLYCDRVVMSSMQAMLLNEQGYFNVQVYRP